jgi:hypothetical protein
MMMPFYEREPECQAFLYELYKQSAGDARRGVPYDELIDALGFSEHVTKRIQRELQWEGLVELTAVPLMTIVGRLMMDHAHRQHHQQTISMTPQGIQLMEDFIADRSHPAPPKSAASQPLS